MLWRPRSGGCGADGLGHVCDPDGAAPAQTGWEEIADYALSWATEQAAVWAARHPQAAGG
jgi:hypothetical protein